MSELSPGAIANAAHTAVMHAQTDKAELAAATEVIVYQLARIATALEALSKNTERPWDLEK